MSESSNNPFSLGQVTADLFMANAAIKKAETMTCKQGKYM